MQKLGTRTLADLPRSALRQGLVYSDSHTTAP